MNSSKQEPANQTTQRSSLPGELGEAADRELRPDEQIVREIAPYRGYGLILTGKELILVVGGILAGLKAHEQHILRLPLEEIEDLALEPEKLGCLGSLVGPPLVKLVITPVSRNEHDPKWDKLMVDYRYLSEAVQIISLIKYAQGKLAG